MYWIRLFDLFSTEVNEKPVSPSVKSAPPKPPPKFPPKSPEGSPVKHRAIPPVPVSPPPDSDEGKVEDLVGRFDNNV